MYFWSNFASSAPTYWCEQDTWNWCRSLLGLSESFTSLYEPYDLFIAAEEVRLQIMYLPYQYSILTTNVKP
jgi:hypothetical protein